MAKKTVKKSVKSDLTSKLLILDAYIALCYEIGVANVTLQKIADKAGVAFGTVRYYFSSEMGEAIYDEAFKRVMEFSYKRVEEIFGRLRESRSFNPVHAYVQAMFTWIQEDPAHGSFLIYYYYLSSSKTPSARSLNEVIGKARVRVESLLLEAIGKQIYKPVKDDKQCAASIHASVIGHGFVAMALSTKDSFASQKSLCIKTIDSFIKTEMSKN